MDERNDPDSYQGPGGDLQSGPKPVSDDDSYAVIDDALTALADRRHSNLGDDIEAIGLLASLIDQAARWLPRARHQRPRERRLLAPHRPQTRHQPRRSTPALLTRLIHRRHPTALQLLKTNERKRITYTDILTSP